MLRTLVEFRGTFRQAPPRVSAKKVAGERAYKLARNNVSFELKPVEVTISDLRLLSFEAGSVSLEVTCSSGTYIRSIAHDLGQRLGCGALLSNLRRTRVGGFSIDNSHTLDSLTMLAAEGRLAEAIIPSGTLLPHIPGQYVDAATETQIRQGRDFRTSPFVVPPGTPLVKALSYGDELVAIGELRIPNVYHPSTVL